MAMFSSSATEAKEPAPKRPTPGAQREPGLSIIAAGMRVEGQLNSDGIIKVEGLVVGTIHADHQVLVAKGGSVEGDIHAREAIVGGEVRGSVLAEQRVEVQSAAVVLGDITTQRIIVHEGGEVNGHLRMGDPNALARKTTDSAKIGEAKPQQVHELPRPQAATH